MKELEEIVKSFEESSRSNEELAEFIKLFGGYFISRMEERDRRIKELQSLLEESITFSKSCISETSSGLNKLSELHDTSVKIQAERIFWEAMRS